MKTKSKVAQLALSIIDKLGSGTRTMHMSVVLAPEQQMKVYVRWSLLALPVGSEMRVVPAITIGSVYISEDFRRQGLWTHFADVLTEQCRMRGRVLMVENVLNVDFRTFFTKADGWQNQLRSGVEQNEPLSDLPCYVWGLQYAEHVTKEDRVGYMFNKIA